MKLTLVAILVGCTHPPPAAPVNTAAAAPPPGTPIARTLTCYQRVNHVPPDPEPVILRRTLDPVHHTISEQEASIPLETFTVTGDRFTDGNDAGHMHIEGQLVGEPWHWMAWTETVTYRNGTTMVTSTKTTETGLVQRTEVKWASGKTEVRGLWSYDKVGCRDDKGDPLPTSDI